MIKRLGFYLAAIGLAVGMLLAPAGTALAHGKTTVGDYELEIGFHNEPVIQGEANALDLFVTNSKTNEKVKGLEDSLQAEIIFGGAKKTLKIEPQEDQDGAYTAFIIPTATGDYTWHIFGKIKDTPVDVSMTSSPTTFNSAEPQASYAFPEADPSLAQLKSQASAASASAQTALIVGAVGVVVGVIGLAVGLAALQAARREREAQRAS